MGHRQLRRPHPTVHHRRLATTSSRTLLNSYVAAACLIGTTIEFYDFFIYGTAAALVFPKLFFPEASPFLGTVLAFATFGVGFIARPARRR